MARHLGRISVLVAHSNRLYRESLARSLERHPQVHQAWCAPRVESKAERQPDVVIIDLGIPDRDGLSQARQARRILPKSRILMTGCSELEADVIACAEAGAAGLVQQGSSLEALMADVVSVANGNGICSPRAANALLSRVSAAARRRRYQVRELVRITPRELEIIQLISERLTNKQIASRLGIRLQTVKNHVHSILEKLQLDRRDQAVRFARDHGLLKAGPPTTGPPPAPRRY